MSLEPFLKWPGGKRWLREILHADLKSWDCRYIEPFLGGGAMFFRLQPEDAIVSDVNKNLIEVYSQLTVNPDGIQEKLLDYQNRHCKDFYYEERDRSYSSEFERACQFLYLNRTCFNGIYRVNLSGKFNVPIGDKKNLILPNDDFKGASKILQCTQVLCQDFSSAIEMSSAGDMIYADPPYTVKHNNNGFVKYNENLFSWSDQVRLRDCLQDSRSRGARVVVSNANHESILDLYRDDWKIYNVSRSSVISAKSVSRGRTTELVISSTRLFEAEKSGHLRLIEMEDLDKVARYQEIMMEAI